MARRCCAAAAELLRAFVTLRAPCVTRPTVRSLALRECMARVAPHTDGGEQRLQVCLFQ